MLDDHEGQRVSRRKLARGITALGFGGVVAAYAVRSGTVSAQADEIAPGSTSTDLTSLLSRAGTCTLTPVTTKGPYYFDADKIRNDVREDRPGKRLQLVIRAMDSESCSAISNAIVEIWQCDASGLYSGAEVLSSTGAVPPWDGPGERPDLVPQDDKRYLRGAQVTNRNGIVQFTTIWPGFYTGRTVHIHVMVHVNNSRVLTTQLMFDEAFNTEVFATPPYSAKTGRDTFNDNDQFFLPEMLMHVVKRGDGYLGAINLAADSDQDGS
jgi:protocatechuate 3,4-dioxygenase beta subunit